MMTSDMEILYDMRNLRSHAMSGDWSIVLEMYKDKEELRRAMIAPTGGTVLHMAVSSGKEHVVESMLNILVPQNVSWSVIRELLDDKGNTPLHLAASLGNVEMCKTFLSKDLSLSDIRNSAGETPIFMAALNGHIKAFRLLYVSLSSSFGPDALTIPAIWSRENGDTFLHCAIAGGHIDLAMEILSLYKDDHVKEMMKRNKNGLSPLHLLAATPSAFQSTDLSGRSFVAQLLYHWFFRAKKHKATMQAESTSEKSAYAPYFSALEGPLVYLGRFLFPFVRGFLGNWLHGIRKMKDKHTWSLQLMDKLLEYTSDDDMLLTWKGVFKRPSTSSRPTEEVKVDTPLMIAAKNGVIEMVKKILEFFPHTINDVNDEGKNIVLLPAEKRQTKVYQILCENKYLDKSIFSQMDKDGNTALHLAAKLGVNLNWHTTTMVEEFKWFQFVKSSVPSELWKKYNNDGKTAEEIFRESYKEHMARDRKWLDQTSRTCSVASTLVASMAFSNIVSDKFDEKNHSVLVALSLSLTSTISFSAILAFRSQSLRFWRYAPFILQVAILTMFGSIVALWISLMFHAKSITTYAILGSPIAIFTILSLPIFIGRTLMSMLNKLPPP